MLKQQDKSKNRTIYSTYKRRNFLLWLKTEKTVWIIICKYCLWHRKDGFKLQHSSFCTSIASMLWFFHTLDSLSVSLKYKRQSMKIPESRNHAKHYTNSTTQRQTERKRASHCIHLYLQPHLQPSASHETQTHTSYSILQTPMRSTLIKFLTHLSVLRINVYALFFIL